MALIHVTLILSRNTSRPLMLSQPHPRTPDYKNTCVSFAQIENPKIAEPSIFTNFSSIKFCDYAPDPNSKNSMFLDFSRPRAKGWYWLGNAVIPLKPAFQPMPCAGCEVRGTASSLYMSTCTQTTRVRVIGLLSKHKRETLNGFG